MAEYAANKAGSRQADGPQRRTGGKILALATFRPASDTGGKIEACGYRVSITRRIINEKWDQDKLEAAREILPTTSFSLFRKKYEPDRRALKTFMRGESDGAKLRAMLIDACATSAGKPSIKSWRNWRWLCERSENNQRGPAYGRTGRHQGRYLRARPR